MNPKISIRRRLQLEKAQSAALLEQNKALMEENSRKPKKWVQILLELVRIIIAACAGGAGSTIL